MENLGPTLGDLLITFGVTLVGKKILKSTGKYTMATVYGLAGYSLAGIHAVNAFLILKGAITVSASSGGVIEGTVNTGIDLLRKLFGL